ncbi:oligosaccharide flippase family protein [uncultured Tenacibaculum sp.]|uniref:lipopolysaccharide biosynthesis protein n=1 Tax=uncultured Tenacibaculum sp. TaxID=174713 RepID=UPI00260BCAAE|nr:oligosaccharide flippase family protein [uncultured Tenacibaculum sp.]
MGIIFKQSFRNTIVIYLGFAIGAINAIIFYPNILQDEYHGLITFLLSASNLFMPLIAFGIHNTIIKFFSSYQTQEDKDKFLSSVIVLPLLIALPIGFFWDGFHDFIISRLNAKNDNKVEDYTLVIYVIAVCCAYFEVFYSWAKVHLKTVLGNVLKEFYNRAVVFVLLLAVFWGFITKSEFIYTLMILYIVRTLIMMFYAFKVYFPKLSFRLPTNTKEILKYSAYIFLAGSAGAIIIDIDKLMIPGKEEIKKASYYAVAVYIGSFIEAPGRALGQILQPLTSKSLNENNEKEVSNLYQKSSLNLILISGLFFLLVNCSISQLFRIMPEGYSGGEMVVLMISLAKMFTMSLGNNRDIINNSKFYRMILPIGLGMAASVYLLNKLFYFSLDFGTEGLALSTLISLFVFNVIKLWFVKAKFNMNPYTEQTYKITAIILLFFGAFYFWDFSIPELNLGKIPVHILLNIILKSALILIAYLYVVYKLKISTQFNALIGRFAGKFKN